MTKKVSNTAPCSDWFRGWGYGGNNKLGKLSKLSDTKYSWTGYAQGRHGQKLRSKWTSEFDFVDGQILNATDSLPDSRDVKEAIALLG